MMIHNSMQEHHTPRHSMMSQTDQSLKTRASVSTATTDVLSSFNESFVTSGSASHNFNDSFVAHSTTDELLEQMEYNRKTTKRNMRARHNNNNNNKHNSQQTTKDVPTMVVIGTPSFPVDAPRTRSPRSNNRSMGSQSYTNRQRSPRPQPLTRGQHMPRNTPRRCKTSEVNNHQARFSTPMTSHSFGSHDARLRVQAQPQQAPKQESVLTRISRSLSHSSTSKKCMAHVSRITTQDETTKHMTLLLLTSRVCVQPNQDTVSLYTDQHRKHPGTFTIVSQCANTVEIAVTRDDSDNAMAQFLYHQGTEGMKLKLI
ncbi:expressed unknown protein [Seminavis robusta]|uniref:Uncharacterized protein n=1 Tax=Seminavis robusta TaxID=568900 RepID=A0A9N8DUM9_9STRA|nr:expressed unknown protein [Seminavis robusta]|eukprot:Sro370_g128460.1 n/a (314) ;mRNA; f:35452-36393